MDTQSEGALVMVGDYCGPWLRSRPCEPPPPGPVGGFLRLLQSNLGGKVVAIRSIRTNAEEQSDEPERERESPSDERNARSNNADRGENS
jgi:hypothetical protein